MRRALVMLLLAVAGCSASEPTGSAWVELEPMDVARSEHPAVVLEGDIVVIGGFVERAPGRTGVTNSVESYHPPTDSWRRLPDLPEPRHHAMAAVVDGRLFVVGGFSATGFDPVSTVWELAEAEWVERASLPRPAGAGAAVSLDGRIYVIGGVSDAAFYRYSPELDAWDELPPLSQKREHLAAVTRNGEIWALGGRWQGEIFASTEIYEPVTGSWRQGGPVLTEPRSGFGAAMAGDTIVVAGGEVFAPDQALTSVEFLEDGEWVERDPLPFGLHGNPLVVVDSSLYVPGGSTLAAGVDNPGTMLSRPLPDS